MKPVSKKLQKRILRVSKALEILAARQAEKKVAAPSEPPPIPEEAKQKSQEKVQQKAKEKDMRMKVKQFILDKNNMLSKAVESLESALMSANDTLIFPAIKTIKDVADSLGKIKFQPKQAATKEALVKLSSNLKYASALVKLAEAETKKSK